MNSEVIAVATHEEGLFKELINNNFNIKVKVLGFGEKWTGGCPQIWNRGRDGSNWENSTRIERSRPQDVQSELKI